MVVVNDVCNKVEIRKQRGIHDDTGDNMLSIVYYRLQWFKMNLSWLVVWVRFGIVHD